MRTSHKKDARLLWVNNKYLVILTSYQNQLILFKMCCIQSASSVVASITKCRNEEVEMVTKFKIAIWLLDWFNVIL